MDWEIAWDEDGYPTDESLQRLADLPLDFFAAAKFVANGLGTTESPYARVIFSDGTDGFRPGPMRFVSFSTGGWSGNEALISAATGRFDVGHFLCQWNAGGHWQFCVPLYFLEPPPAPPGL